MGLHSEAVGAKHMPSWPQRQPLCSGPSLNLSPVWSWVHRGQASGGEVHQSRWTAAAWVEGAVEDCAPTQVSRTETCAAGREPPSWGRAEASHPQIQREGSAM